MPSFSFFAFGAASVTHFAPGRIVKYLTFKKVLTKERVYGII